MKMIGANSEKMSGLITACWPEEAAAPVLAIKCHALQATRPGLLPPPHRTQATHTGS